MQSYPTRIGEVCMHIEGRWRMKIDISKKSWGTDSSEPSRLPKPPMLGHLVQAICIRHAAIALHICSASKANLDEDGNSVTNEALPLLVLVVDAVITGEKGLVRTLVQYAVLSMKYDEHTETEQRQRRTKAKTEEERARVRARETDKPVDYASI